MGVELQFFFQNAHFILRFRYLRVKKKKKKLLSASQFDRFGTHLGHHTNRMLDESCKMSISGK